MPASATVDEPSNGSTPSRPNVHPVPAPSPAVIRTSIGTSSATVLCCGNEMSTRAVGATTVTRRAVTGVVISPSPDAVPQSPRHLGLGDKWREHLLARFRQAAHGVVDCLDHEAAQCRGVVALH